MPKVLFGDWASDVGDRSLRFCTYEDALAYERYAESDFEYSKPLPPGIRIKTITREPHWTHTTLSIAERPALDSVLPPTLDSVLPPTLESVLPPTSTTMIIQEKPLDSDLT